jgi:hypothetical protein
MVELYDLFVSEGLQPPPGAEMEGTTYSWLVAGFWCASPALWLTTANRRGQRGAGKRRVCLSVMPSQGRAREDRSVLPRRVPSLSENRAIHYPPPQPVNSTCAEV